MVVPLLLYASYRAESYVKPYIVEPGWIVPFCVLTDTGLAVQTQKIYWANFRNRQLENLKSIPHQDDETEIASLDGDLCFYKDGKFKSLESKRAVPVRYEDTFRVSESNDFYRKSELSSKMRKFLNVEDEIARTWGVDFAKYKYVQAGIKDGKLLIEDGRKGVAFELPGEDVGYTASFNETGDLLVCGSDGTLILYRHDTDTYAPVTLPRLIFDDIYYKVIGHVGDTWIGMTMNTAFQISPNGALIDLDNQCVKMRHFASANNGVAINSVSDQVYVYRKWK